MPWAALSRRQYAGFRSADWTSHGGGVASVRFDAPDDFARVKPPLFPVPAAVVTGSKSAPPSPLPATGTRWTGRVPGRDATWAQVQAALTSATADVTATLDELDGSPYRALFTQGATLVPSVLMRVERLPAPAYGGMPAGRTAVRPARTGLEKPPWKLLETLEGVIEDEFLYPMHVGATITPFRSRPPGHVVIPWSKGRLLSAADPAIDEFPGLADWWRGAEKTWNAKRSSKMTLHEQIDFQGKLRAQFPTPKHRVLYSASGQHLAACRLDDPAAVIEHKLYWGPPTASRKLGTSQRSSIAGHLPKPSSRCRVAGNTIPATSTLMSSWCRFPTTTHQTRSMRC